jgi:histidine triad (HIT) family protein
MPSIFSKIIAREIPARIVYEDDLCLAFHDANPQAPTHILVIPKKEIPRLAAAGAEDQALLGHLLLTAREIAQKEGIAESGFRIVINNGPDGGETVPHLHVHLLGGRHLDWPPG